MVVSSQAAHQPRLLIRLSTYLACLLRTTASHSIEFWNTYLVGIKPALCPAMALQLRYLTDGTFASISILECSMFRAHSSKNIALSLPSLDMFEAIEPKISVKEKP